VFPRNVHSCSWHGEVASRFTSSSPRHFQKCFLSSECSHSFTRHERYTLRTDKCLVVRALCISSPHTAFLPSRLQQEVRRCLDVRSGTFLVGSGASRWVVGALLSGLFFGGVQKSPLGLRISFVFSEKHHMILFRPTLSTKT
jgi:hypothetical protein